MTKIKIPVSTMGTPLTEEELKSIVGGMDVTKKTKCHCVLSTFSGVPSAVDLTASFPEQCVEKCDSHCNKEADCRLISEVTYTYVLTRP